MGSSFTVFFDGTFWVGVAEVADADGSVRAARHVFGAEPGDAELWEFVRREGGALIDRALAAPAVAAGAPGPAARPGPKRAVRLAARDQRRTGTSTAAQAALSAAREASATARASAGRLEREQEARRRRELDAAKRKARHRGR